MSDVAFQSAKQVSAKISLSPSQIREMARRGEFPQPIQISQRRQAWLAQDVEEWCMARVPTRRPKGSEAG